MNNNPLLTVIVPCYNVEKYIDKCLVSIVSQIYNNLEILLINDESTDSTGKSCDEWQVRDLRIKVVHKQNEGLAYARKTGLEHSTGEYIAFVDPDDWIDEIMYSEMMSALLATQSDIVLSKYCMVYEDGSVSQSANKHNINKVMSRIEAMIMILKNPDLTSFCTSVFKKKLFDQVAFPKGRGYAEDLIIHNLFHKASQTVFLDREYYYYLQRSDSITKQNNIQAELKKHSDFSDAYCERYSFVIQHVEYHSVLPFVEYMTTNLGLTLLRNIIIYPKYFSKDYFYTKAKQILSISLSQNDLLQRGLKIDFYLLKISPNFYIFLRLFYVRIIRLTNFLKITNRSLTIQHYWNIVIAGKKINNLA